MGRNIRLFTCALFLLSGIWMGADLSAQEASASADWETLPAIEFSAAAKAMFAAQPPASLEELQLAAERAWTRFLTSQSFVEEGDWNALVTMVSLFAGRRDLLTGGGVTAQQVDAGMATLYAQVAARFAAHPEIATGVGLYELDRITRALGSLGFAPKEKAQLFLAWMNENDWRQLPLHDLYNLYSLVNVDAVDRCHFSARWSGFLTAPATGAYTLRQAPQYAGVDSRLIVYVNDQIVLDSSIATQGAARFQSSPVQLSAGQATSLRVEMVHDIPRIEWSEGAPMVVLTWETEGERQQIIPSSAFTPPDGFSTPGSHGLRGEYFQNMEFGESKIVRLDPALDLISSWPPMAPLHQEAASETFEACTEKLLDTNFLASAAAEGDVGLFSFSLWRIAYRMTGSQRIELVKALTRSPECLAIMTPEAMGRLMQAVYMLPGDEHLELFGEWALARPQPRCEAGEFPGWGERTYQYNNLDFYWLMGLFWQGAYWEDAEKLWDDYLIRPDGECNLAVAYATAFAARKTDNGELILARLKEQIDDDSLSGDQLATWYIARAFAKGALTARPEPLAGLDDLQGAMISAESDDYAFWALQEMVARLSSCDQADRAKALIEEHRGRFSTPEQQAAMTAWIADADSLAAKYVQRRQQESEKTRAAYVAELQQRRDAASRAGDEAGASRFDGLISAASTAEP